MKIDTTAISGYSDMSAEQKIAALEAFEYEDNSAELERLKNAVSKANSEAADWKKKHAALLSEDEKKKLESDESNKKILEELESLRKDKTVSEYTAKYMALGYDKDLAADTAKAMAEGDMQKVFANGEKHREALEKSIKEKLMKDDPRPGGGGGKGDGDDDSAVKKAKEIAKARTGGGKQYEDIMKNYKR